MPKIKFTLLPELPAKFLIPIVPVLFLLVLPIVLSACNTQPVVEDVDSAYDKDDGVVVEQNAGVSKQATIEIPASTDEAGVAAPATEQTGVAQKQVKLDADSLFNILAAEFAGNIGDIEASLEHYRQAAKSIEDSRIAARTAYIALYGEKYDEALADRRAHV